MPARAFTASPSAISRRTVRDHVTARRGGLYDYKPVNDKAKAFHLSEAKTRCIFKGNQAGGSTTGRADVVARMQGTHPLQMQGKAPKPPLQWRILSTDFPALEKHHIPQYRDMVNPASLRGGSWGTAYHAKNNIVWYADGGFVEFMSYESDQSKHAQVQRDGCWFDEEPPNNIWMENQARLMRRGGINILTMTADQGVTWVYDSFELPWQTGNLNPKEVECFRWSLFENPYIPKEEIERFMRGMDPQTIRIKVYGEFVHRSGLIFEDFKNRTPWVYDEFKILPTWPRYICIDSHPRKNHAVLLTAVSPSGEIWAYKEIFHSNDIDVTCDALRAELDGIQPHDILIDSASRGDDYKHGVSLFDYYEEALHERHLPTPTMALKEVGAGVIAVRACFQWDSKIVTSHAIPYDATQAPALLQGNVRLHICRQGCPRLIWQLMRYVYDDYTSRKMADRRDPKGDPRKKDDDLIDNLRYIVMEEPHYTEAAPEDDSLRRKWRRVEPEDEGDAPDWGETAEYEEDWRLV